jgi:hypothetical protein
MNQFFESAPSRARNSALAGLAVGAFALGFSGTAEAKTTQPSRYRQAVERTERRIEHRLAAGKPVAYDANYDVLWSPKHSKFDFKYRTEVPLTGKVEGEKRYFRLVRRCGSVANMEVHIIPKTNALLVQGDHTYVPPQQPEDPHVVGTFDARRVASHSGTVDIAETCTPAVNLTYEDGGTAEVPLAPTLEVDLNGPIVA